MNNGLIYDSVATVLANQSWFQRRKNSIAGAAGNTLQILSLLVGVAAGWPVWLQVVLAVLIGVAEVLTHACTKGAVTPSMAETLDRANVDNTLGGEPVGGEVYANPEHANEVATSTV